MIYGLNVLSTIKSFIESKYGVGVPTVCLDEFNPNVLGDQIVLEDYPQFGESISKTMFKRVHKVKVSVYVKPLVYDEASLDAAKLRLINIKDRLDVLFVYNKYSISGLSKVNLGEWDEAETVSRGFGVKTQLLDTFVSSQTLTVTYYDYVPNDAQEST